MAFLNIMWAVGVHENGLSKESIDTESHGLTTSHQRYDECISLVKELVSGGLIALYVWNRVLSYPNEIGQKCCC